MHSLHERCGESLPAAVCHGPTGLASCPARSSGAPQPIWLTEFSRGDQAQPVFKQQSYMKDALDYLENAPSIFVKT